LPFQLPQLFIQLEQSDGTEFQARQWGDEWYHGWETIDGYTILYDASSKNWVYAEEDLTGKIVKSNLVVGKDFPLGIPKHLRLPEAEVERTISLKQQQRVYAKTVPSTGVIRVPVILINFSDTAPTYTIYDFYDLLFAYQPSIATGPGSMADYYSEVSYGNLTLTGNVVGWVTADYGHDYYGEDIEGDDAHPAELVREAVEKADPYFDFSSYDNNGDGYVDCVIIIHQGTGQEASDNSYDIWSHRWSLSSSGVGSYTTDDGVIVNDYAIQPEIYAGDYQITTIGVFCHEFGHLLGLPDLYDTDKSSYGIGNWGIMGGGNWNYTSRLGDTPAHFMAWCKWFLGWVNPTKVTGTMNDEIIKYVEGYNDVYQLLDNPGGPQDWSSSGSGVGEYFLVENRQKVGFDAGLPSDGLLIWHIDESIPNNRNEYHKLVDLEEADGWNDLDLLVNKGDAGDPFPGSYNNRIFNDNSNPNSKLYDGSNSNAGVTDISNSGLTMTADLFVYGYPDLTITNITSTPNPSAPGQEVQVTVEFANQGNADADTFFITLYKNRNTEPGSEDQGDYLAQISGLATGTASSYTFTYTYDTAGTKKIWAQIDRVNLIDESNEDNNISDPYNHVVTEQALPDLTITNITSTPNPSAPGQEVQVTVEFANQGNADASAFYLDLYANQDTAPVSRQWGDKFTEISGLAAGATSSYTFTYTYNTSGTKKIWAQIDTEGQVNESNESNNIYGPYSHQVVSALPDLTITNITSSPNPSALYQDIQVTVEFKNQGNADAGWFWIDLYTDRDTAPGSEEGGDRIHFVSGLPAGAASSYTFSYIFYLTEGEKKIWAQIDTNDDVSESNENNNIYGPYSHQVVDVYKLSFSTSGKKWRMFSVPVELYYSSPSSVLEDDLGEQNDTVWKVYRWNTEASSYTKYPDIPDIKPGIAFWIITKDSKNIDIGGGECVDTSSDYVIPLCYSTTSNQDWNQIGNPFLFPVRLDDVKVKKGPAVVSLQQAQEYGWVRNRIWWYTGSEYDHTKDILKPWEGYWVKALVEGCELLIPPIEAEESSLQAITKPEENYLQITAKVGNLKDSYNFIGFSDTAKDSYDKEDVEEAPPVSPYISLSFPHPDWGRDSGSYTQDIRKTPNGKSYPEEITWNMQVKTDQIGKTIILDWKNTQAIPEEYYLYLVSEQDEILANMRKVLSYSFTSLTGEENFRIIATKEAHSFEEFTLTEVGNYPNPVHSEFTNIRFHLGKEAKVTIKIYTISGELVRTLVQEKTYSQGLNEEPWDLKNVVKTSKIAVIK